MASPNYFVRGLIEEVTTLVESAWDDGFEEGKAEGLETGLEEGNNEGYTRGLEDGRAEGG